MEYISNKNENIHNMIKWEYMIYITHEIIQFLGLKVTIVQKERYAWFLRKKI